MLELEGGKKFTGPFRLTSIEQIQEAPNGNQSGVQEDKKGQPNILDAYRTRGIQVPAHDTEKRKD